MMTLSKYPPFLQVHRAARHLRVLHSWPGRPHQCRDTLHRVFGPGLPPGHSRCPRHPRLHHRCPRRPRLRHWRHRRPRLRHRCPWRPQTRHQWCPWLRHQRTQHPLVRRPRYPRRLPPSTNRLSFTSTPGVPPHLARHPSLLRVPPFGAPALFPLRRATSRAALPFHLGLFPSCPSTTLMA
jgi:hypothetical protein